MNGLGVQATCKEKDKKLPKMIPCFAK